MCKCMLAHNGLMPYFEISPVLCPAFSAEATSDHDKHNVNKPPRRILSWITGQNILEDISYLL